MKIHSIHHQRIGRQVNRLLAICGAVLLGITACEVAPAQGFLNRLTGEQSSEISLPSATAGGEVRFGNEAFRVVKSSAVRTAPDRGEAGAIQLAAMQSCGSCGTSCGGACGGSYAGSACGSCGTSCGGACGGGYGGGYSGYAMGSYNDACGIPCDPYYYGELEGLYMRRDVRNGFSLSQNYELSRFDYQEGGRVTIGCLPNCVNGCEVTFAGISQWSTARGLTGVGLQSFLVPGDPIFAADLTGFTNADSQFQRYEAQYYSLEANRTVVGWDVSKLLYGVRYIQYDEDYRFLSSAGGVTGTTRSETENSLVGGQVGMDVAYPISRYGWVDIRGRAGVYLDFAESKLRLINDNALIVANNDDKTKLAGMLEFGSGVRYEVGEILSVSAGGELWYIADVASAVEQYRTGLVTPAVGRSIRIKDDVFFFGLYFGAEMRF